MSASANNKRLSANVSANNKRLSANVNVNNKRLSANVNRSLLHPHLRLILNEPTRCCMFRLGHQSKLQRQHTKQR